MTIQVDIGDVGTWADVTTKSGREWLFGVLKNDLTLYNNNELGDTVGDVTVLFSNAKEVINDWRKS